MTTTLTQQLARRMRKGIVKNQEHTLEVIDKMATRILITAMVISYFHQVGFLLTLAHLNFGGGPEAWIHTLTMGIAVLATPLVVDFLIVMCVKVLGAKAVHRISKKITLGLLILPVGISGLINGMAPAGHWLLTLVFLAPVAFIPIAELIKLLAARIDLVALGEAEAEVAAQTETVKAKAKSKKCVDPDTCKCLKHPRNRTNDPVAAVQALRNTAPVSPAAPRV